jgi:hypothetical protein
MPSSYFFCSQKLPPHAFSDYFIAPNVPNILFLKDQSQNYSGETFPALAIPFRMNQAFPSLLSCHLLHAYYYRAQNIELWSFV